MAERDQALEQMGSLEQELNVAQEEIESLRLDLDTAATERDETLDRAASLEEDLDKRTRDFGETVGALQTKIASLEEERDGLIQEAEDLRSRIPTLEYDTYTDVVAGFEISYPADWDRWGGEDLPVDLEGFRAGFAAHGSPVNAVVAAEPIPAPLSVQAFFDSFHTLYEAEGFGLVAY